jgi:cytoplasmic iron level regulating protein YaaA (DUF328/UPF0246 family)
MLFLLPPSECKVEGGSPLTLDQVALTFGGMQPARDLVLQKLVEYSKTTAAKTKMRAEHLQQNLEVLTSPTMPAIDRYSGTLYDALQGRGLKGSPTEFNTLTKEERERAKESVFVQSALFGLIPASNLIPNYRFSAGTKLQGFDLKKHWNEAHHIVWKRLEGQQIIDLRSNAYAELAPIPEGFSALTVEVFDINSGKAMNHFNKKAKGQFVRAYLQGAETIEEMAKGAGFKLELDGKAIKLFTNQR